MSLYVVRHAPTQIDPAAPSASWSLAADAERLLAPMREHLPQGEGVSWWASTEPKAIQTAQLLTSAPLATSNGLCEVQREGFHADYDQAVATFFAQPDAPSQIGWETAADAQARFVSAVREAASVAAPDVVVVAHGLVITLLHAELSGAPPSMSLWRSLRMPDVLMLDEGDRRAWVADDRHRVELRRPTWGTV